MLRTHVLQHGHRPHVLVAPAQILEAAVPIGVRVDTRKRTEPLLLSSSRRFLECDLRQERGRPCVLCGLGRSRTSTPPVKSLRTGR